MDRYLFTLSTNNKWDTPIKDDTYSPLTVTAIKKRGGKKYKYSDKSYYEILNSWIRESEIV